MDIDLQINGSGNVENNIGDRKCIGLMKNMLDGANIFSVGIDWKYWDNDDKFYEVSPRFSDLKTEIMEYKHIHNIIKVYQTQIYKKQWHIIKQLW